MPLYFFSPHMKATSPECAPQVRRRLNVTSIVTGLFSGSFFEIFGSVIRTSVAGRLACAQEGELHRHALLDGDLGGLEAVVGHLDGDFLRCRVCMQRDGSRARRRWPSSPARSRKRAGGLPGGAERIQILIRRWNNVRCAVSRADRPRPSADSRAGTSYTLRRLSAVRR